MEIIMTRRNSLFSSVGVALFWVGAARYLDLNRAPAVALLVTGVLLRPALELTREGLLQRQYPFSSLTRWDVIQSVGITRAGNRVLLAYKLVPDIPPPRRQPAAALLRAAGAPYDGGYFADSLAGSPEALLSIVESYLRDPTRRQALPAARR